MKATYDKLKGKISHEGIIIGVLPTIFEREQTFSIYETASLGLVELGRLLEQDQQDKILF